MIKKYYWIDNFDGGERSKPFNSIEEAKKAAKEHVADIRLTQYELNELIKKYENFVSISYIEYSDDATADDFNEAEGDLIDVDSVEINEKTLDRIY